MLALVALAISAPVLAMATASAAPRPGDVLPDLVADPVADEVLGTDASGGSVRLLLRFAGFVHNKGQGAVEIRGSRPSTSSAMSVTQRLFDASGAWHDDPSSAQLAYEEGDGHLHWHLMHAARYSLWNSERSAQAAPAMKVGFCLEDSQHVDSQGPRRRVYGDTRDHRFCEQGNPNALSVFQGISAGWRDEYHNELAFQWVDVSSVRPGYYWLRSDVDPDDVVVESGEVNQAAWAGDTTTIPGYIARAVDGGDASSGQPRAVTLSAEQFGSPGPVVYRIESGPANGSLNVTTGGSTSSPTVYYTARPGYQGVDSFTYSARAANSGFPRSPATATVSMRVAAGDAPTLQLSGAPESMVAGTSVHLQATVTNDGPGVTWSVDGMQGGSAALGTITPDGLYRAPAQPPAAGAVTIAARSAGGAADERRVRILPVPVPQPAPLPPSSGVKSGQPSGPSAAGGSPGGKGTPGLGESKPLSARLTKLKAVRVGRGLILTAIPMRSGVVRLRAYSGGVPLGSCSTRTPAGRRFTCRLRIRRGVKAGARIGVVASLRVNGRVVAVKRLRPASLPGTHVH